MTRDEIRFHKFLNMIRKERKVPLRIVCYGLCSDTMMNYIESGDRLPDYRMRNRIMARLGVPSEEYEDFVQYDEYERWQKCQELISAVEKKNEKIAEIMVSELLASANKSDKVENQLLLDMKSRIMEMKGEDWNKIAKIYSEAINLTIPEFKSIDWNKFVFSPDEYYIVIRWMMAEVQCTSKEEKIDVQSLYERICKSIQRNLKQAYSSSKVYPMAVYGWFNSIKTLDEIDDKYLIKIWKHSCEALEKLRQVCRTYYLIELLQIRQLLRSQIISRNIVIDCEDLLENKENDWLVALKKIYDAYAKDVDINYSGYIYNGSEVHCISDIISSRRRLYGLSRKELAEGICNERTLIRIEKKQVKPQHYVVEQVFSRLGVVSDYLRAEVLTNDYDTLTTYSEYKHALNDSNYKKADLLEKKLFKIIDFSYCENRQIIANIVNNRKIRTGEIDKNRYYQNMKKILEMTLPQELKLLPEDYLSDAEIIVLKNLAFDANIEEYQDILVEKCEKYYINHIRNYASLYEFIMGTEASNLGNVGKYDESNKISADIIYEALSNYRAHAIHRNIFNITWNKAKKEKVYNKKNIYDELLQCVSISSFCKDYETEFFYKSRINLADKNEDWTL